MPVGPDQRFVIKNENIKKITGLTEFCWLFIDIKSVGPRDDFDHTVLSHNQVSGNGVWDKIELGVRNKIIKATGKIAQHDFHCAIPPIYVLSSGEILPVINIVIKPVYSMRAIEFKGEIGQPLSRVSLASIPNGLLLHENPGYLNERPNLFFPGKDDKGKDPRKLRARLSFEILREIDTRRFSEVNFL